MDANTALQWLYARCAATSDPVLPTWRLAELLTMAAVTDDDGYAPDEDDWTPTYGTQGLYRAAAEAWTIKAGMCADRFDFTTDGQTFRRSQVMDHCEALAARYRRKAGGSVTTPGIHLCSPGDGSC